MADGGNGIPQLGQKEVVAFELAIRWVPATGQLQVVGSQVDEVTKLGMLEMAKVALINQNAQRAQSPVIVPGRFAS
jgi:hypothetical protein